MTKDSPTRGGWPLAYVEDKFLTLEAALDQRAMMNDIDFGEGVGCYGPSAAVPPRQFLRFAAESQTPDA